MPLPPCKRDFAASSPLISRLRAQRPDVRVTILRPAALVGPGVDTTITRHFETPRLLVLGGSEPMWQFVHVEDVASAILTLLLAQEDLAAPSAPEQADPVPPARDVGFTRAVGKSALPVADLPRGVRTCLQPL